MSTERLTPGQLKILRAYQGTRVNTAFAWLENDEDFRWLHKAGLLRKELEIRGDNYYSVTRRGRRTLELLAMG